MKICAYVSTSYVKRSFKNECFEARQFFGLKIIIDVLERNGYKVEYAGKDTVHLYDFVLVSLTSDCDWWQFIAERVKWQKGNYKVIIGGAGLLHVVPFLPYADYFILGRGENAIVPLIKDGVISDNIIDSKNFSMQKKYRIAQADIYPYGINITRQGKVAQIEEKSMGCNHKCYFCAYTWQREHKFINEIYKNISSFGNKANENDKERAILDSGDNCENVNFNYLRITAMDGFSERLRFMVNKKITKAKLIDFLCKMIGSTAKPHELKLYNIVGYPTETEDDWQEFIDVLEQVAKDAVPTSEKSWYIVLHNTPFRAVPATPFACAPMAYKNYRGRIALGLRAGRWLNRGNSVFFIAPKLWACEGINTESLPTVILSALCHRGGEKDTDNIRKIAISSKFGRLDSFGKQKILEKLFDMDKLFGSFTAETLPSRYLQTYVDLEPFWHNCRPWGKNKTAEVGEGEQK